jgi:hypothetical protein
MRVVFIPVLLAVSPLVLAGPASADLRPTTGPTRAAPAQAVPLTQPLACPASIPMQKVHALPAPWSGGTIGQELTGASMRKRFGKDVLTCNYNTGYTAEAMTPAGACAVANGARGFVCARGTQFSIPN